MQWDNYKDQWHVQYQDSIEATSIRTNARINHTVGTCRHGPRVLVGIFTIQHYEKEMKRRNTIRETDLSFFKDHPTTRNDRNRICTLLEFLSTMSQEIGPCWAIVNWHMSLLPVATAQDRQNGWCRISPIH